MTSSLIGQSLGRYHILEQLGEGGMAVVYKGFDTRLERNVAIKVILPGKEHSEKFLKRFEREAKALAQLSHPNIVKVIDYGEHDGLPYLVMEYLPGGTLKQKLIGKPMLWQEAVRILLPLTRALAYAHEQKIIHRDVKSSNILITQSGEPMLSDFGIAKMLEAEETMDLTGTGVGVGTPEYMSPEQAQGKNIDARADVYSLGVVLYEMVTGRKPYQAETPMAVVWKLASEPLPRPRQFQPELPEQVEAFLIKALARDPANRFQSMHEFGQAIEQFGTNKKTASTGWRRSRLLIGIGVFIILAITGFGWWRMAGGASETATEVPSVVPSATEAKTESPYFDQFDDPAFEGGFDASLWSARISNCQVFQENGSLKFVNDPQGSHQECDLYAQNPAVVPGSELGVFEVEEFISSDYNRRSVVTQEIQFRTDRLSGGTWIAMCGLIGRSEGDLTGFMSVNFFGGSSEGYEDYYGAVTLDKGYDAWHTVRLDADPKSFRITCEVDGELVGAVVPRDASLLKSVDFSRVLEAARGEDASATSYVDNVMFATTAAENQQEFKYLMELQPLDARAELNYLGYGIYPWSEGPMVKGQTIFLLGRYFEHALFAHATSSLKYALNGKYQRLETQAYYFGPCEPSEDGAVFRVLGDGKLLYESPMLEFGDEPMAVAVPLTDVQQLQLTTDALSSASCDWTIWLDPILIP